MTLNTRYSLGDWIATPYLGLQWGYVTDIVISGGPGGQPAIRYVVTPYTTDIKVEHDWTKTALVDEQHVTATAKDRPPGLQLARIIEVPRLARTLTELPAPGQ